MAKRKKKKKKTLDIELKAEHLRIETFTPRESFDLGIEYGMRIIYIPYGIKVTGQGKIEGRLRDRLLREIKKEIRVRYSNAGKDVGRTNN